MSPHWPQLVYIEILVPFYIWHIFSVSSPRIWSTWLRYIIPAPPPGFPVSSSFFDFR
ncbi:hypothetical protein BDV06DRAFT_140575 [Aspergillus oleicola]